MSEIQTRREVIRKLTAAGAAALVSTQTAVGQAAAPSGAIDVRQTAGARRYEPQSPLRWRPARGSSAESVVLDPAQTYQQVLGFGAALTDAACYDLNRLP